jgi:putative transposase
VAEKPPGFFMRICGRKAPRTPGRNSGGSFQREKYRSFVEDMIGKDYENPLDKIFGGSILGSVDFVDEISTAHIREKKDVNIPALKHFASKPSFEEIRKEVAKVFHDNEKLARQVTMFLCHKYSGMGLQERGTHFDVRDTAISKRAEGLPEKWRWMET